jgi:pimeloyl-ACP methyl ester carboxylesterase
MPFADLGQTRLHYTDQGDGPPLVLLAGMMSDGASWGPVVPALAARFRVIRPDNRTTGQTLYSGPVTLDDWAQDVADLLDHLGLTRTHVAGHSLGGLIALHLAASHCTRIDRLALIASGPVFLQRNVLLFRHLLALRADGMPPDLWLRALFPWLFNHRTFDDDNMIETMIALSLGYPHAQAANAFAAQIDAYAGAAHALRLPDPLPLTLAILAQDDLLTPPALLRPALASMGPMTVVQVADAGHSVHWDAPEAVVTALMRHFGEEA